VLARFLPARTDGVESSRHDEVASVWIGLGFDRKLERLNAGEGIPAFEEVIGDESGAGSTIRPLHYDSCRLVGGSSGETRLGYDVAALRQIASTYLFA
jgi:hypothetical protein